MTDQLPLKRQYKKRADSKVSQDDSISNLGIGNLSRDDIAHGEARAPRRPMTGGNYKLYINPRHVPEGCVGRYFDAKQSGRIDRAKEAYWSIAKDPDTGAVIERNYHGNNLILMVIDKRYKKEDDLAKDAAAERLMSNSKDQKVLEGPTDLQEDEQNSSRPQSGYMSSEFE